MCHRKNGRLKYYTVLISLFSLAVFSTHAGRPLSTTDAHIVDKNTFELEPGYEAVFEKGDNEEQKAIVSLKYGIAERFDLGLEVPYSFTPENGFGHAELGMKFMLYRGNDIWPAIALKFANELGTTDYTLKGILTKKFTAFRIDMNGGYTAAIGEKGTALASMGIKWYACKRVSLVTEAAGKFKDEGDTGHLLIGAVVKTIGEFEPDIGIMKLLGEDTSHVWGVRIGFTQLF